MTYQVFLNDDNMDYETAEQHFHHADLWAKQYCPSYQGVEVQDVADFSYTNDMIAMYSFEEEKDKLWFTLKWL